jgi:hypothetical protein
LIIAFGANGSSFAQKTDAPKEIAVLVGHTNSVGALALTADGKTLISGSDDMSIRVWDVASGKPRFILRGHRDRVIFVAMTPDGKTLASVDRGGTVKLWDLVEGKERGTLGHGGRWWRPPMFANDGRTLTYSEDREQIHRWDIVTGTKLATLHCSKGQVLTPDGRVVVWDGPELLAFSGDLRTVARSEDREKPIELLEFATGKPRLKVPRGGGVLLSKVEFHPTGRMIACNYAHEAMVKLVDGATGELLFELKPNENERINETQFSADGKVLATAEWPDTLIRVWDISGIRKLKPALVELGDNELEQLWAVLAGDDGPAAYQAIWKLAGAKQSTAWLGERLRPIAVADPKVVASLIADLDHNRFAVRDKAASELERLGEAASPALRQVLTKAMLVDQRERVEAVLKRADALNAERLRAIRAVEALEHAGTPEAKRLLEKLAAGFAEARLTREANASVERSGRVAR